MALFLVSTTTGLCLSGRGNRYKRTSPRPIAPATTPPAPRPQPRPRRPDVFGNPADRGSRSRAHAGLSNVREGPPESDRNGLPAPVWPLHSWPEATPNPTLPEWFPHYGG